MLKSLWNRRWRESTDALKATLGNLEREVMEVVWRTGDTTVKEVQASLPRPIAYTTVMTTLDRLFKKGFVARTRSGRAFVYRAVSTRPETEAAVARGMMAGLLGGASAVPILSNLVDAVGSREGGVDLLDALEEMVRAKRRELEEGRSPGSNPRDKP